MAQTGDHFPCQQTVRRQFIVAVFGYPVFPVGYELLDSSQRIAHRNNVVIFGSLSKVEFALLFTAPYGAQGNSPVRKRRVSVHAKSQAPQGAAQAENQINREWTPMNANEGIPTWMNKMRRILFSPSCPSCSSVFNKNSISNTEQGMSKFEVDGVLNC